MGNPERDRSTAWKPVSLFEARLNARTVAKSLKRVHSKFKARRLTGAEVQRDLRALARQPGFHDRSLSRGQKLSRRATEERGCKSFLILRRVCWPLSRGSYFG